VSSPGFARRSRAKARQLDRLRRYRQDDLLELRGQAVLGGEAPLVLGELTLHLDQLGPAGLPDGDVLDDSVHLQRAAVQVPDRVRDRADVLDPAVDPDPVRDVHRLAPAEGGGRHRQRRPVLR
jgi:hypothetical protein